MKNYKNLSKQITQIVNTVDPVSLIIGGAPDDEYSSEVASILINIKDDPSVEVLADRIYQIFEKTFDTATVAPYKGKYTKIAEEVSKLYSSNTPAEYEKTRLKHEIDHADNGKDEDIEVRFIRHHCTSNKEQLAKSKIAGCFYCLKIFDPKEIENWNSDKKGDTAICPYCVMDSVYGDASGREVSKENLEKLHNRWF